MAVLVRIIVSGPNGSLPPITRSAVDRQNKDNPGKQGGQDGCACVHWDEESEWFNALITAFAPPCVNSASN
jgi:hypothetical protein